MVKPVIMKYYFFKFPQNEEGEKVTQLDYWLQNEGKNKGKIKNVIGDMAVAVYYGKTTTSMVNNWIKDEEEKKITISKIHEEMIKNNGGTNYDNLKTFFNACKEKQWPTTRFLVFDKETILILQPISVVNDLNENQLSEYLEKFSKRELQKPKYARCKFIKKVERKNAPSLLATMTSDQSFNRNTCKEIKGQHKDAINFCLDKDKKIKKIKNAIELLDYLSPVQFETLVFLNFHERDYHCHAHRGSTTVGFDFIVKKTDSLKEVEEEDSMIDELKATIEVKHKTIKAPTQADYTVALRFRGPENEKILDGKWLLKKTFDNDKCFTWLMNELEWIGLNKEEWDDIRIKV